MNEGKVWKVSQRRLHEPGAARRLRRPYAEWQPEDQADDQREENHVGGYRCALPEAGERDEADEARHRRGQPRPCEPPADGASQRRDRDPRHPLEARAKWDQHVNEEAVADERERVVERDGDEVDDGVPEGRGGDGGGPGQRLGVGRQQCRDNRGDDDDARGIRYGCTRQNSPSGRRSGCFSDSARLSRSSITAINTTATPFSSACPRRRL